MPPKSKPRRDYEIEVASAVFAAALEFFAECGLEKSAAAVAFKRALNGTAGRHFPSDPQIMLMSDLLRHWHTSSAYTDSEGAPIALPARGQHSLSSLVRDVGFTNVDEAIASALNLNLIIKKGRLFLPTDRDATIPYSGTTPLWYASQASHRAFKTMTRNLREKSSTSPLLFHRVAHQLRLPKKSTPIFRRFVLDQGTQLSRC